MLEPVNVPGTSREYSNWTRRMTASAADIFARAEVRALAAAVLEEPDVSDASALLQSLIYTAQRAGGAIMAVYATDFSVRDKADASPVTAADEAAEKIILADLARLAPDIPVVAEEAVAAGHRCQPSRSDTTERFFLVDPLDGTREFVSRRDEFTVNIALIEAGKPVLGVVYAPARRELYWGDVRCRPGRPHRR